MKYFAIVLALLLAGCQQQSASSAATSTPDNNFGTLVWQAGSTTIGNWITANTYQCGNPVNTGNQFYFDLKLNGTSCGRNQANPTTDTSGDVVRLTDGDTYTWTFNYIDGNEQDQAPGMGLDTGSDPESLIWQIHGYDELDSPCTGLTFVNGAYYSGQPPGQEWSFSTCNGNVWFGAYTPQEQDTWRIVATISEGSTGETKLFRNGTLMVDDHGANYHNSSGNPWWNFGPYKWRWELPNGGGSNMTEVQASINRMRLYDKP